MIDAKSLATILMVAIDLNAGKGTPQTKQPRTSGKDNRKEGL